MNVVTNGNTGISASSIEMKLLFEFIISHKFFQLTNL